MTWTSSSKIFLVIWCVLGCGISGSFMADWIALRDYQYSPPLFENLRTAQGRLSFTTQWKTSGGRIKLRLSDGTTLTLTCGEKYAEYACFRKLENGQWVDYERELTGKNATVWWHPLTDKPNFGVAYQLLVDGKTFFSYSEKREIYLKDFQVVKSADRDFWNAILFFGVMVVPSIYGILRKK